MVDKTIESNDIPHLACIACGDRSHDDYCETCRVLVATSSHVNLDEDGPTALLIQLRAQEDNGQVPGGRRHMLWSKYGISLEHYQQMAMAQSGRCAICSNVPEKSLVVDHDHATGLVRGLLCGNCNIGIGMLADNPLVALAAAEYLQRTSGKA